MKAEFQDVEFVINEKEDDKLTVHITFTIPYPRIPVRHLRYNFIRLLTRELLLQEENGDEAMARNHAAKILFRAMEFYSSPKASKPNKLKTIRTELQRIFKEVKRGLGYKKG